MAKIKTYANDNTINANDKLIGTDFNDSDKTKNYLISALKDYILSGLDTRPYKVYTALLEQDLTGAPVATVLENTLGGTVVWSRLDPGEYQATVSGLFTLNKTMIQISSNSGQGNTVTFFAADTNTIDLGTADDSFTLADNLLNNTPIEIRVYN